MITAKALKQVLDAAQKSADEGPCFCDDEDCEYDHDDPSQAPTHAITFVTADGRLDKAENKKCLSRRGWGIDGPLEFVLDHPQCFPEDAPRMVVIERATGQWWPAVELM